MSNLKGIESAYGNCSTLELQFQCKALCKPGPAGEVISSAPFDLTNSSSGHINTDDSFWRVNTNTLTACI